MARLLRALGPLLVAGMFAGWACHDAGRGPGGGEGIVGGDVDAVDTADAGVSESDGGGDGEVASCTPGESTCTRGVVAECDADGDGWTYHACPRGEICERDGCVPNRGLVQIVANSPAPIGVWKTREDSPVDPTLAARAVDDWEQTNSACSTYLEEQLVESDSLNYPETSRHAEMALIEKYWIRRLARDLADEPVDLMLMGPPTGRPGEIQPGCEERGILLSSPSECVGGDDGLWSGKRFDDANEAALSALDDPDWVAPDLMAGELDWEAFDALIQPMVKVGPDGTAADILPWVDGRFETEEGGPCEEDADCGEGWCIDERCERVVEPELNLFPIWLNIVRSRMAYLALAGVARPEGRPCEVDADCGRSVYRCRDGRCRDPAAPCRVRDTVLVTHFDGSPVGWNPAHDNVCTVWRRLQSDLDLHYARWMRWGCACDAETPCPERSTCRGVCWVNPEPTEFCSEDIRLCTEDHLYKRYEIDSPHGPFGSIAYVVTPSTCEFYPSARARDVAGRPFLTRTHTILTQDSRSTNYGGHQAATAAAYVGEGVAVTPCGGVQDPREANINPKLVSHMISCDYETRYQQLVERLRTHADNVVCNPDDVGLPPSSGPLIR
ncbi:MAG: hypothetical protein ACQEXJ_09505 [Myxococcota bacterium]